LLEILAPNGTFKKYVKFAASIMLSICLATPILNFGKRGENISEKLMSEINIPDINTKENDQNGEILDFCKENLSKKVSETLCEKLKIEGITAKIELCENFSNIEIKNVAVKIPEKSQNPEIREKILKILKTEFEVEKVTFENF
jgi:hypothetical protein